MANLVSKGHRAKKVVDKDLNSVPLANISNRNRLCKSSWEDDRKGIGNRE